MTKEDHVNTATEFVNLAKAHDGMCKAADGMEDSAKDFHSTCRDAYTNLADLHLKCAKADSGELNKTVKVRPSAPANVDPEFAKLVAVDEDEQQWRS